MPRKWAIEYIDALIDCDDHMALIDISTCIQCSPQFNQNASDYDLPSAAFVFVEMLLLASQSIRSSATEYFEVTPLQRQEKMQRALLEHAPAECCRRFENAMRNVTDWRALHRLDDWVIANDSAVQEWMHEHLRCHRELIHRITA